MNNDFTGIFNTINDSDMPPTSQAIDVGAKAKFDLELLLIKWMELRQVEINKVNISLAIAKLQLLSAK